MFHITDAALRRLGEVLDTKNPAPNEAFRMVEGGDERWPFTITTAAMADRVIELNGRPVLRLPPATDFELTGYVIDSQEGQSLTLRPVSAADGAPPDDTIR